MKRKRVIVILSLLSVLLPLMVVSETFTPRHFVPKPPPQANEFSAFRTAPIEVALVFGRSQGCENAAPELVNEVAAQAASQGVDPKIAAATVAVESGCNPFAISSRGAVGYMQVMPKVWKDKYDFSNTYNLLNQHDNIRVGVSILAENIQRYGTAEGVRRYQGTGVGCDACDGAYTDKILHLAGRR